MKLLMKTRELPRSQYLLLYLDKILLNLIYCGMRQAIIIYDVRTLEFRIKHQVDTLGKQARKDTIVCPWRHEISYETSGITSVTIFILIFGRNFIKFEILRDAASNHNL